MKITLWFQKRLVRRILLLLYEITYNLYTYVKTGKMTYYLGCELIFFFAFTYAMSHK